MKTAYAITLFVIAAAFIILACKDTYAPTEVVRRYGALFGNPISYFWARFVCAAGLISIGVWVLS